MGRKSLTRKQIKHHEEPLIRLLRSPVRAFRAYPTQFLAALSAIIGLSFGWIVWSQRIENQAPFLLEEVIAEAQQWLNSPIPSGSSDFNTMTQKLHRLIEQFDHPRVFIPGAYYLASLYLQTDRPDRARSWFQRILNAPEPIGSLAHLGYAESLAALGQYDQALAQLKVLRQKKPRAVHDDFLLYLEGRWKLRRGQRAAARQAWEQLLQQYPGSPLAGEVQRRLQALRQEPPP